MVCTWILIVCNYCCRMVQFTPFINNQLHGISHAWLFPYHSNSTPNAPVMTGTQNPGTILLPAKQITSSSIRPATLVSYVYDNSTPILHEWDCANNVEKHRPPIISWLGYRTSDITWLLWWSRLSTHYPVNQHCFSENGMPCVCERLWRTLFSLSMAAGP